MKANKVVDFLNALNKWHDGEIQIAEVCLLLGDPTCEVGRMLQANGVADFQYKPMEGFSSQAVVNIVLTYLSMRHAIRGTKDKDRY